MTAVAMMDESNLLENTLKYLTNMEYLIFTQKRDPFFDMVHCYSARNHGERFFVYSA
jgi:hypothetical protein